MSQIRLPDLGSNFFSYVIVEEWGGFGDNRMTMRCTTQCSACLLRKVMKLVVNKSVIERVGNCLNVSNEMDKIGILSLMPFSLMSHMFLPTDLLNFDSGTFLYNGYSLFFCHYDIPIF